MCGQIFEDDGSGGEINFLADVGSTYLASPVGKGHQVNLEVAGPVGDKDEFSSIRRKSRLY